LAIGESINPYRIPFPTVVQAAGSGHFTVGTAGTGHTIITTLSEGIYLFTYDVSSILALGGLTGTSQRFSLWANEEVVPANEAKHGEIGIATIPGVTGISLASSAMIPLPAASVVSIAISNETGGFSFDGTQGLGHLSVRFQQFA
jgi:hypothetical protein